MKRRLRLTLLEGSFEIGFPAILQISSKENPTEIETQITGRLPPAVELWSTWQHWQRTYHQMVMPQTRIKAKPGQITNISCRQSGSQFSTLLNRWLNLGSEQWLRIRDCLHRNLHHSDEIEFVIQTNDKKLQQLPWHLWDFFSYYPHAEIAISTCEYQPIKPFLTKTQEKVKILALLGDRHNLDLDKDRAYLEQLSPQAQIEFLVEPQIEELNDRLWETDWNIFFFAGHSCTHQQGQIWLNQNDVLTLEQLKYALKKAIDNGLCLAIFNSCDGLGLARELADLQLGQIIVMREPVSDAVAQTFLKHFLTSFAEGKSLYNSVRTARERLQKLETKYPYATWLPVIFQNPAAIAPTWRKLTNPPKKRRYWFDKTLFSLISFPTGVLATAFILELKELDISELIKSSVETDTKRNPNRDNTPDSVPEAESDIISIDENITDPSSVGSDRKTTLDSDHTAPNLRRDRDLVSQSDRDSDGQISLTQIEDINGDSIDEILISIPDANNGKTKTYIVYGREGGFNPELDLDNLDGNNGLLIKGIDRDSISNISISQVDDLNGDEVNEIAIATPNDNSKNIKTHVVYSKEDGFNSELDLDNLDKNSGFVVYGIEPDSISDLNGDKVDETIPDVGDSGEQPIPEEVIENEPIVEEIEIPVDSGGEEQSTKIAEDVPVDVVDEIKIAKSSTEDEKTTTLDSREKNGTSSEIDLGNPNSDNSITFDEIEQNRISNISINPVDNLNNDETDEIAIEVFSDNDETKELYVVFSKDNSFPPNLNLNTLDGIDGFKISGIEQNSTTKISRIEDINGDEIDEIIVEVLDVNDETEEMYAIFSNDNSFPRELDLSTLDGIDGFKIIAPDFDSKSNSDDLLGANNDRTNDSVDDGGYEDVIVEEESPVADDDDEESVAENVSDDREYVVAKDELPVANETKSTEDTVAEEFTEAEFQAEEEITEDVETVEEHIENNEPVITEKHLLIGGVGNDTIVGDSGDDLIIAGENNDRVEGRSGSDRIFGNQGNDTLTGNFGDDEIFGNDGDDRLFGSQGNDTLTGGEGEDRFIFQMDSVFDSSYLGVDRIRDFTVGEDKILLSKNTFEALEDIENGRLQNYDLAIISDNTLANGSSAKIIYHSDSGNLSYNSDGTGEFIDENIFAQLIGSPDNLSAEDFQVVDV